MCKPLHLPPSGREQHFEHYAGITRLKIVKMPVLTYFGIRVMALWACRGGGWSAWLFRSFEFKFCGAAWRRWLLAQLPFSRFCEDEVDVTRSKRSSDSSAFLGILLLAALARRQYVCIALTAIFASSDIYNGNGELRCSSQYKILRARYRVKLKNVG